MNDYKVLKRCYNLMKAYKVHSDFDMDRYSYVVSLVQREVKRLKADENANKNEGLFGDVFEVLNRPTYDQRIEVATQNRHDTIIMIDGIRCNAELKHQDGRIAFLNDNEDDTVRAEYVIYKCFLPYNRKGIKGETPSKTVIMTVKQFKDATLGEKDEQGNWTIEPKATTSVHKDGEPFIRVNKKWFDYVNRCLEYDRMREYKSTDFEF